MADTRWGLAIIGTIMSIFAHAEASEHGDLALQRIIRAIRHHNADVLRGGFSHYEGPRTETVRDGDAVLVAKGGGPSVEKGEQMLKEACGLVLVVRGGEGP